MKIKVGTKVRDKMWGGKYTGTVTAISDSGQELLVAWDGTVVEDSCHVSDVEVIG